MVSNTFYNSAKRLLEEGKLKEEQIDIAVRRVIMLKDKLGLFENPYRDADEELEKQIVLCNAHREAAYRAACESVVLLKNNGVLPLENGGKKILLSGPFADSRQMLDAWSAYGKEEECITLQEAFESRTEVLCIPGVGITEYDEEQAEKAYSAGKECDVIVLALGEHPLMSGESGSRMDISLPGYQEIFAEKMFELGKPVIVVMYSGRPLAIPSIAEKADAVLEAWFPGTEGNRAVYDVVSGNVSPSGRLTMSFPYGTGQCPIYYNRFSTGRPAKDVYHSARFSSRYVDGPCVPLYPFGYGLTYTEFEYSDISLDKEIMKRGESVAVSCVVRNVGERKGIETVQLYIQDVSGSRVRPIRMLRGYERIELLPGEQRKVEFTIDEDMLKFYTIDDEYKAEAGKFKAYISPDASKDTYVEFELLES